MRRMVQIKPRLISMIWKACFANRLQMLQCQMVEVGAGTPKIPTVLPAQMAMKTRPRNRKER